ncbi:MAG: GNAT family N-acetyltransferase, partial [Thermodesulfobacteriota bacterium]|nr:GNAT family N-acetyltransferase [Thermodesulfobacteriota bacterium]
PSKVPAAKFARLAVAQNRQRQGLGTQMMINAMKRVLNVTQHLGIIGFFCGCERQKHSPFL